jgi:hypothetical protein
MEENNNSNQEIQISSTTLDLKRRRKIRGIIAIARSNSKEAYTNTVVKNALKPKR